MPYGESYSSSIISFTLNLSYLVDAPDVLAEGSASRNGAHAPKPVADDWDEFCTSGDEDTRSP